MEIPATKTTLVEGNQDFVFLEKTSEKVRYSTLKLQELNAKLKALQEENEQIQRALSEDLCNQVKKNNIPLTIVRRLSNETADVPGVLDSNRKFKCLP